MANRRESGLKMRKQLNEKQKVERMSDVTDQF